MLLNLKLIYTALDMAASSSQVLDALQLDEELESLLYARCESIFAHCGGLANLIQPELRALLRGALWYLSTQEGEVSPGQMLLNLHRTTGSAVPSELQRRGPVIERSVKPTAPQLRVARTRSVLYGMLVVLVPWAWSRLSQMAADPEHPERMRWLKWLQRIEAIVATASVFVSLRFLQVGRSPTLPMALIGMQLALTMPARPRRPIFELMEQQLVWRTLAEFSVAARGLYHSGGRLVHAPRDVHQNSTHEGGWFTIFHTARRWLGGSEAEAAFKTHTAIPEGGCVFCGACPPHTPVRTPCGHLGCYFCLSVARMASAHSKCPSCKLALAT